MKILKIFYLVLLGVLLVGCNSKFIDKPSNLRVENNVLYWNEVDSASSYTLKINDDLIEDISSNQYALNSLEPGIYSFSVKGEKGDYSSEYSNVIWWNNYSSYLDSFSSEYNKSSLSDFRLDGVSNIEQVIFAGEDVKIEFFDSSLSVFTLVRLYLLEVEEGTYEVWLYNGEGIYLINLEVVDEEFDGELDKTYVPGRNVVFNFDMEGKEFLSLSGNGITEDDYTFNAGVLTIKYTYIISLLEENPDRERIILDFRLVVGLDTEINYLVINID